MPIYIYKGNIKILTTETSGIGLQYIKYEIEMLKLCPHFWTPASVSFIPFAIFQHWSGHAILAIQTKQ